MKKLLIISGISGAGKTTASNILEDLGYRCIDQYPPELLGELIDLIEHDNSIRYDNVALTISLTDLEKYDAFLSNSNLKPQLILIDCDKDIVINRYKFTRRVHPLLVSNVADTISEAIDIEKNILDKYKKGASIINTGNLSVKDHRILLKDIIENNTVDNLSLSFVSFGFKNGVPADGDMVFDVRFLDNPFYDPALREKTGNDKEVKDYVLSSDLTKEFLKKLISYIDFTIEAYNKEDKRHLTICVGCTGGQHRSVVVTNYLYEHYKDKYTSYLNHNEL